MINAHLGEGAMCVGLAALIVGLWSSEVYPPISRGHRGSLRSRMRKNVLFRCFDYGVRLLTVFLRKFLTESNIKKKDQEVISAGELWGLEGREITAASLLCGGIGFVFGVIYICLGESSWWVPCVFSLLVGYLPSAQLSSQKKERERSIERALPFVMDLIYMTMGAGLDFSTSLKRVIQRLPRRKSPIRFELERLLNDISLGTSRAAAMRQFAERNKTETSQDFAHWVIQSEEKGTPLREILRKQASSLRQRRSVMAEESAAKAGAAMMVPMMMMFMCILILVLAPLVVNLRGVRF